MRWVALAAANGPSSLFSLGAGGASLLHPPGLRRHRTRDRDSRGGRPLRLDDESLGQRQGFLAGWLYWASNITFFPTLTLSRRSSSRSTPRHALRLSLERSPAYVAGASLVLLAIAVVFNIVGMKTGKWVQNIGVCPNGCLRWHCSSSDSSALPPRLGHADAGGVANAQVHVASDDPVLCKSLLRIRRAGACADDGGEVVEPKKTFPRAIVISGLSIAAVYSSARSRSRARYPARSRSSPASTRRSRRLPARSTACPGSEAPVALLMIAGGLRAIGALG